MIFQKLWVVLNMITMTSFSKILCIGIISASIIPLSGCGNVRNTLGLTKESPDEFAVITRAPLELPPSFTLPAPVPGMARPQEKSTIDTAKDAVFGQGRTHSSQVTSAETALLDKAGASQADANIRNTIDQETREIEEKNRPVADKILNLTGRSETSHATVVDQKKEYDRIQKNIKEGKSVLEGETPVIEE